MRQALPRSEPAGVFMVRLHAATHVGGVQKYWYDANGNMTTRKVGSDTYTHTWDYENRLTQVKKNGVTAATYTYDGNGALVKKVAGGVTTVYVGSHYEKNLSSGQVTKYTDVISSPVTIEWAGGIAEA